MKSTDKHNNLKFVFASVCVLIIMIYFLFFTSNLKIEVFNKTSFDIDSLNVNGKFYKIEKQKSLVIKDCQELSIQDNLPFGPPEGIIKNMKSDTTTVFLCGTGVEQIENGNYKFNIEALVEKDYYMLYWTEHK
jgi:hypothetical protein